MELAWKYSHLLYVPVFQTMGYTVLTGTSFVSLKRPLQLFINLNITFLVTSFCLLQLFCENNLVLIGVNVVSDLTIDWFGCRRFNFIKCFLLIYYNKLAFICFQTECPVFIRLTTTLPAGQGIEVSPTLSVWRI